MRVSRNPDNLHVIPFLNTVMCFETRQPYRLTSTFAGAETGEATLLGLWIRPWLQTLYSTMRKDFPSAFHREDSRAGCVLKAVET